MLNVFFHPDFKLNEQSFLGISDLLAYTKNQDKAVHDFLINWFNNDSTLTVYTSGSTGKPKAIKLHKKMMISSALATANHFDLPAKTSAFLCLSADYIAGKMMLVRAMICGWHLDILTTKSNPLKGNTKNYNFGAMVPLQVHHSIADLTHVKQLIIGGGAITETLLQKIYTLKTRCFATYGMTETSTHIAVKPLTKDDKYYTVLPNIKISTDSRNCLVIDAKKLINEPIITNDLVEIINNKQFQWLGRYDNIINSGGIKIIPEKVEKTLAQHIKQRYFISSIPDAILENKLVLIVEGEAYNLDFSNLKLHKYEIPKIVYFLPKFVVTDTQKINRKETLALVLK